MTRVLIWIAAVAGLACYALGLAVSTPNNPLLIPSLLIPIYLMGMATGVLPGRWTEAFTPPTTRGRFLLLIAFLSAALGGACLGLNVRNDQLGTPVGLLGAALLSAVLVAALQARSRRSPA